MDYLKAEASGMCMGLLRHAGVVNISYLLYTVYTVQMFELCFSSLV